MLAGCANVYVAASPDVEEEWEYFLPKGFRCQNGMARVYQPQVKFGSERDAKRHRYFTEVQIQDLSEARVREMIRRGIIRRVSAAGHLELTSIEDVESRRRQIRLQELQLIADDKSKDEYIQLLEEDNSALRTKETELKSRLAGTAAQVEDLQERLEDLNEQKRRLEYDLQAAASSRKAAEEVARKAETRIRVMASLKRLPSTVTEVAEIMQQMFPDELVFTPGAMKSTEDRSRDLVADAWECLFAMATVLHPLLFGAEDRNTDLEKAFKGKTGFDLAMSEGSSTKERKKLMKLRKVLFEGREIDITPHIKIGNKEPRLLRIHFYADHDKRRIVIGHCGKHLENYSTRLQ
jgi:outer membrane murein-binding lipoprotein Lpp